MTGVAEHSRLSELVAFLIRLRKLRRLLLNSFEQQHGTLAISEMVFDVLRVHFRNLVVVDFVPQGLGWARFPVFSPLAEDGVVSLRHQVSSVSDDSIQHESLPTEINLM